MASPTRDAAHGEHACEQIQVNSNGVVCGGGIKVHVGIDAFGGYFLGHDLLYAAAHLEQIQIARISGDLLGERF